MEASGQYYTVAIVLAAKNPDTQCIEGWVGPIVSGHFGEEKNPIHLPAFKSQGIQPIAYSECWLLYLITVTLYGAN
jgi:hypothetical protein